MDLFLPSIRCVKPWILLLHKQPEGGVMYPLTTVSSSGSIKGRRGKCQLTSTSWRPRCRYVSYLIYFLKFILSVFFFNPLIILSKINGRKYLAVEGENSVPWQQHFLYATLFGLADQRLYFFIYFFTNCFVCWALNFRWEDEIHIKCFLFLN